MAQLIRVLPRVLLVASLFAGALLAALAAGCQRPCETAENCKRTCSCLDSATSSRSDCTLAFRCETNEGYCEADFDNLSCDEICQRYAPNAQCGFQRCAIDQECRRVLSCPVLQSGQATGLDFQCELNFLCDQNTELCEVASTIPPEQMCAQLCPQPAP